MSSEAPIVCTLSEKALAERRATVIQQLRDQVRESRCTDHGYLLRLDASDECLQLVFRVVQLERQCCRFLRFQWTLEADGGPLWLQLDGPAGTREFLQAELHLV